MPKTSDPEARIGRNEHCARPERHHLNGAGCSTFVSGPSRHELIVARQQRELEAKRRPAKSRAKAVKHPALDADVCKHDLLRSSCFRCAATAEHLQGPPLDVLIRAVREYLDAEASRTGGAFNLQVRGAARARMLAKEVRRVDAARDALKKLVGL